MKRNILTVIPHYNNEGGAGLYINSLINALKEKYDLRISGPYAKYYDNQRSCNTNKINLPPIFYSFIYPNYLGVKIIFKIYYLIRIIFILPFLLVKKKEKNGDQMIFILTSSIQIPLLFIIKRIFSNSKVVILIQENYLLNSRSSKILNFLLLKSDLVISISDSWIIESKKYGLSAQLLRNSFDNSRYYRQSNEFDYDILFLGGSQSIKGAHNFISLLKKFNSRKVKLRVAWLGHLDSFYKNKIKKIEKDHFLFISSLGFVSDVGQIISSSKLVVFPIEKPHFLRPAIEAGLCKRTYIIKELDGVDDFAKSGYNCLSYKNLKEATDLILQLINDKSLRETLENNNFEFSQKFARSASKDLDEFVNKLDHLFAK